MSGIHSYRVCGEIHLPNEILAIIINNLASEDNDRTLAALASCRLASHVLYSLATPLLFSSIRLTEPRWTDHTDRLMAFQERATKLKQILTTSDIAASVYTLTLRCQKEVLEDPVNGTLILAIIYRLLHIRTFVLKSKGASRLEFTAFTGDFKSAIKALCESPNLTTLDLYNIEDFPITLIACPNLQFLRLSWVGFCVNPIASDFFNDQFYIFQFDHMNPLDRLCKLDSLELDYYSIYSLGFGDFDLDGGPSFPKHFSRIRNLRLRNLFCSNAVLKRGWYIMLLASQSLTTLDLPRDIEFVYKRPFPDVLEVVPFDLGRFPALRHVKIQIQILSGDNVAMLCRLPNRLLSISSSASGIETLDIMIVWVDVKPGGEEDLFSSDTGWCTLDEVLSSEKFVSLKKVVLRLEIRGSDRSKAYYHDRMNLEPGTSLTPPYINTLFSMFRSLKGTQCTLELHVEII